MDESNVSIPIVQVASSGLDGSGTLTWSCSNWSAPEAIPFSPVEFGPARGRWFAGPKGLSLEMLTIFDPAVEAAFGLVSAPQQGKASS